MDELSLAQQITLLFDVRRHPTGRSYTMQEVCDATGISVAAISQMRNGKITNPQFNTVKSLCKFFNVPLRYFDTKTLEECYAIFNEEDQPPTFENNEIAFRANSLSEEAQQDILKMIRWVQAAEKQRRSEENSASLPRSQSYDDE